MNLSNEEVTDMLDKFWENMGSELAKNWMEYVVSPAFLFWFGGLVLYTWRSGWQEALKWLGGLQVIEQAALVVAAILLLAGSSLLMRSLRFSILRLLEGYLPPPFHRLSLWLSRVRAWFIRRDEDHFNSLKKKEVDSASSLSPAERRLLSDLETRLHYVPADPLDYQPTALGTILRSGETAPSHKYGLDAVVCWPRLWTLLPQSARESLSAARQGLDDRIELWAWGLLFLVWSLWTPWALLVSGVWMALAYALSLQAAMAYADLIESAFDLYRWELYKSTHRPLPASASDEKNTGEQLTEFLWRGTPESFPYQHPE